MSIILDKVNYFYSEKTAYEAHALKDVSLKIGDGEFIGIIGHTGSGKSTLIQHLNGLVKASSGGIYYNGQDIYDADFDKKELRGKVGLVFQYPEHQLFETNVFADVCYGPKNRGFSRKQSELKAFAALRSVGLPEDYWYRSPFELSGGQKRRAAIAGVLAMEPEVLVLDEPTAGLDPKGRDEILDQVAKLHRERRMTVILVSHSMEDVAKYVSRLIVMNRGSVLYDGMPKEVFAHYHELEEVGLAAPQVTYLVHELRRRGIPAEGVATTLEEAKQSILRAFSEKHGNGKLSGAAGMFR
ncbi:MAG: energy-coupling factor transporter ATPase [Lachnospiraceae bacterium]|nr:energy-coupling factor transporter ATPase [Lachnospiraceae bacterium]